MASGRYAQKTTQQLPLNEGVVTTRIPPRATRQSQVARASWQDGPDNTPETMPLGASGRSLPKPVRPRVEQNLLPPRPQAVAVTPPRQPGVLMLYWDRTRLTLWILCLIGVIGFLAVPLSTGILQRPFSSYVLHGGRTYDQQVGGDRAGTWQHLMDSEGNILPQSGPYAVAGKPSITVDFINQVLSTYKSPAAGKGQTMYDLGVQYNIDPVFALAFFMHESSFGTKGEATKSLSLGNLRCIPNFRCERNFAQFDTWEDGFEAWYQLIRNLYIAQWKLATVDQIIPRYAPRADNNNEVAYIGALKHAVDTWHAGQIVVR